MSPANDDGRPLHRTGPNVVEVTTTDNEILLQQLHRRRQAAHRLPPLESGDRDPMVHRRSA